MIDTAWVMFFRGRRDLDRGPVVQDGRRGLGLLRLLPGIHSEACDTVRREENPKTRCRDPSSASRRCRSRGRSGRWAILRSGWQLGRLTDKQRKLERY